MRNPLIRLGTTAAFVTGLVITPGAMAEEGAAPAPAAPGGSASASASVSADTGASSEESGKGEGNKRDGFLLAGKVGGIASFNHLDPFVTGGLELGYVLSKGSIALLLDTSYTAPKADGSTPDTRVPGGKYDWELRQKELVFQPTFEYRFTMLSDKVTPYAGIGPRIYLLEGVTRGTATNPTTGTKSTFQDSFERSTKVGFGIPLGAEMVLGPGGLFAELLFQWGPLNHETTGDSHLGGGSLFVGYRAIL